MGACVGGTDVDEKDACAQFVDSLRTVLDHVLAAGVVHMDVRLTNLFFIRENGVFRIRLIDWDDSLLLGALIPEDMRAKLGLYPGFPSADITHAGRECHESMLKSICVQLEVDV